MAAPCTKGVLGYVLCIFIVFSMKVRNINSQPPSTLRQVNLLYRHGDRSPAGGTFPTDPYQEDSWPQGWGQLSKLGMQEQCELGQFLRKRYNGFLNSSYIRTEITVRSTDVDRTLMSAQCNLACLYPPGKEQQWNKSIIWQPIPVHTRPVDEDPLLRTDEPCPKYNKVFNELMQSKLVKDEEVQNKAFYQFISNKTGYPHENISIFWDVQDPLFCEWVHNKTLPSWVNSTWQPTGQNVWDMIRNTTNFSWQLLFRTKEMRRLRGGLLVGEMINNMKNKIKLGPNNKSEPKMHMYSAHDTTVAAMLNALDVFNGVQPPYASMVALELHEKDNSHWVEVLYRNLSRDPGAVNDFTLIHHLTIPNCSIQCPFDKFISLTKDVIPVNSQAWAEECEMPSSTTSGLSMPMIIVISIVGAAILLLVIGLSALCLSRSCKGKRQMRYQEWSTTGITS
ncbi:prostatic acid phosphatase [Lingula anatina]|uniref:acid phosphatase n=1 Tax=Lingula anatina TaxID=7574 RepID=A0A1S3I862_LINAN|nr:prostatic acid phosphatase [Lingula anatina]|eukprot:XP_013394051.1 prostatic acid phosphatase [Lingula anatina]